MDIALWIAQGILALVLLLAGITKLTRSKEQLAPQMGWVEDFSEPTIKTIAVLDLLGAVGLVLPQLTGVATFVTPVAAGGVSLLMIGSLVVHLRRGETSDVIRNVVFLAIALFVLIGRLSA